MAGVEDSAAEPLLVNRRKDADEPEPVKGQLTGFLVYCALVASLSAFNFGYHNGVINIPKASVVGEGCSPPEPRSEPFPDCFPDVDDTTWGLIVGLFALGGLAGGLVAGFLADRFGRRSAILFTNVFFLLGSVLQALAMTPTYLMFGRFFVGMGAGVSSVAVPMYVGEITTPALRGAFGVIFQLSLTVGILFSQVIGIPLSNAPGWRWLLGFTVFISLVQSAMLIFCCESPRWLIMQRRNETAERDLARLRGTLDVQEEITLISVGQASQNLDATQQQGFALVRLLRNRSLRRPLVVAIALSLAQQLSGVNVVFYYSSELFGAISDNAQLLTVLIGAWNVLLTLLAVFLMDRLGRRPLLLFAELGMALTASLFCISYVVNSGVLGVVSAYLFVMAFAVGLGPIPFLIISEIFPSSDVGTASSIALPFNWAANYAVAQLFPILNENLAEKYVFLPFIATNVVSFLFTFAFVPETKGRTLEEITGSYSSSS